ncbi:hypothetical protein GH741_11345 [Aquibacillus halophilus]|uniref:DUF3221 domain-containing protein n=1 Tax=Aquibacillus halophilus TaxID=930132 RepID=A0A6A8DC27_9BACI|nr:hypothetical protein [Aquibacillus halophilus]MRH43275.1 hypothetical protein [Aquibacillus halophilus]
MGLIKTEKFIGEINAINDNVFTIDCSDEVNKTDDLWGFECSVQVIDETLLKDKNGKKLKFEDFKEGLEVEVILNSPTDLMNDTEPLIADKITKLS